MILVDPPSWPGHGRLWSHLVSDSSYDELHAFAATAGIPARGFERDHYDVPAEMYERVLAAGAVPVSSREIVRRLHAAGLRRRKRRPGAARAPS
ncbi:MAG: DUF4031 domain-containing protein [Jiangellaceae bacterium]